MSRFIWGVFSSMGASLRGEMNVRAVAKHRRADLSKNLAGDSNSASKISTMFHPRMSFLGNFLSLSNQLILMCVSLSNILPLFYHRNHRHLCSLPLLLFSLQICISHTYVCRPYCPLCLKGKCSLSFLFLNSCFSILAMADTEQRFPSHRAFFCLPRYPDLPCFSPSVF